MARFVGSLFTFFNIVVLSRLSLSSKIKSFMEGLMSVGYCNLCIFFVHTHFLKFVSMEATAQDVYKVHVFTFTILYVAAKLYILPNNVYVSNLICCFVISIIFVVHLVPF